MSSLGGFPLKGLFIQKWRRYFEQCW